MKSVDTGSDKSALRLLARDSRDIEILSALLQDAIIPGVDMLFDRDGKRFIFIANRFCWERPAIAEVTGEKGDPVHERCLCAVEIRNVHKVLQNNMPAKLNTALLNLLAVTCDLRTDHDFHLDLLFSADATIRLLVENINVAVEDVEASRPTTYYPKHDET